VDLLTPGTVLFGKYRVEELIGTGGMGRVVRASHLYLQQQFAIKVLLPQMMDSSSTTSRFLREAQAVVQLKGEHVAKVIDVGTMADGAPFMLMEYLSGNDLNQILRHHGAQPPPIVCDLMLQACEGLAEAHALGIIHRDIKPSNFFITQRSDGSMLLKVLDFGISKSGKGLSELTGTQTVIGTPTYMAPEQMKSGKIADARSDIWSMGVVMYQLLTGRPPFEGETYAELVLKVNGDPPSPIHVPLPNGLGEVILRCLEKDPKDRLQNCGELARMLAPFATDPVASALSATRTTRILSSRGSGSSMPPLGIGGGLATPVPLSPAQLTPHSWPPSSTSLSQGNGQVTYKTRAQRGALIAGVAGLVVVAALGGFLASRLARKDDPPRRNEPYVTLPQPSAQPTDPSAQPADPPAPPPPPTAKAEPPVPTPTITEVKTPTIPAEPEAKVQIKSVPRVEPKAEAKAESKPKPKTENVAKSEPKPKPKGKPKGKGDKGDKADKADDLFGTRK
jgi:eukaryotic-like serine/threonine-protein kinase